MPKSDTNTNIDLTPSRREYLRMLEVIRDYSTKPADRKWAREEIERANKTSRA